MKPDFDPRKAHEKGDTLPEQANVYVPPRPLAQISDHRTMDIKAIRIAAEIDPRQAKTIVRMQAPVRRRRGLVLFAVSSCVVLGLLAAAAYVTVVGPQPLPLSSDSDAAPRVAPPPVEIQTAPAPVVPRAASPEPPSAPVEAETAVPPPVTAPATASVSPPSRPAQRVAPRKPKVSREPWLE
ncbi:MAG TPA: hypothetical protein VMI54_05255 [Polyangiaceae bacterium]|nr:hypothetical protein [Polyangiaceae bacterium]